MSEPKSDKEIEEIVRKSVHENDKEWWQTERDAASHLLPFLKYHRNEFRIDNSFSFSELVALDGEGKYREEYSCGIERVCEALANRLTEARAILEENGINTGNIARDVQFLSDRVKLLELSQATNIKSLFNKCREICFNYANSSTIHKTNEIDEKKQIIEKAYRRAKELFGEELADKLIYERYFSKIDNLIIKP